MQAALKSEPAVRAVDPALEAVANFMDLAFYESEAGQGFSGVEAAAKHYLTEGWKRGLNPSPSFSTAAYLSDYPDVRESGMNPLRHFLLHGRAELRRPQPAPAKRVLAAPKPVAANEPVGPGQPTPAPPLSADRVVALIEPDFDPDYYIERYPDLKASGEEPIRHFLRIGWREHRDPSATFNTADYLRRHAVLHFSGMNPLLHWVLGGRREISPTPAASAVTTPEAPAPRQEQVRILEDQAREQAFVSALAPELKATYLAFDAEFYRRHSPDLKGLNSALFEHFHRNGWREHRNPSADFNTRYYLENNPDIRRAGVDPFVHFINHGRREGRPGLPYLERRRQLAEPPLVTAIVPNFNHARFLAQRLESIDAQTYPNLEIIILDDASNDDSAAWIEAFVSTRGRTVRKVFNERNSGGVFLQWRKGLALARGDLIWICESDDHCELDFLERLVPHFVDRSVMVSFGKIQFSNPEGQPLPGLDAYREAAEAGIWQRTVVRSAQQWFSGAFGISNLIANVGGCLLRAQDIADEVWEEACRYRISGDWYLYLMLARGGRMAYEPSAVTYFRQHGANTSVRGFMRPEYYTEHHALACALRRQWGVPEDVVARLYANLARHYHHVKAQSRVGALDRLFSFPKVVKVPRSRPHVLICFLGFHLGGGELVPIYLANALVDQGLTVSMLALDSSNENPEIRRLLRPCVPVYDAQLVEEMGVERFLEDAGVSLIHSHAVAVEFFFFQKHRIQPKLPYLVTLHGSYEVTPVPDDLMFRIIRCVTHWFYLADKNLAHLDGLGLDRKRLSRVNNGVPLDDRAFEPSREALGLAPDTFVFVIASRALREKGWLEAVAALKLAQARTERRLHLLLCGDGKDLETMKREAEGEPGVSFLGYQDRIHGAYRLSDCVLLPSRFQGESLPLTLIQAMQVGKPIIASTMGQIPAMLERQGRSCGLLIDAEAPSDDAFVRELAQAMGRVLEPELAEALAEVSLAFGADYSAEGVAKRYADHYRRELKLSSPISLC